MRLRRGSGVAAVIAASMIAVACGGSSGGGGGGGNTKAAVGDRTGITATTITLGSHQPLTGPAAPGYSEIAPAMQAYFDYVNSQGGINGRQIKLDYQDDAYNPTQTVDVVRKLVLQDQVAAIVGGLGTPTHTKVLDYLNSRHVPDLFVSSGCLCWNQPQKYPYTFGWQPDYYVEGKILGAYIKQHFPGKKIAYFFQNDDFGQDGVRGLDKELDPKTVVARQSYEPTNTNVASQVQAFQSAKADVVVSFSIPAFTALLKLNALKIGYNPQLVVSNVGSDPVTLAGLLESIAAKAGAKVNGQQLLEGIISDTYLPPYLGPNAGSNSWIQLFKKIHDSNDKTRSLPFDGNVMYGMAVGYTFAQVLKNAGPNPDRAALVSAVERNGLVGPGLVPFRFSPTSHAGYEGVQVAILRNGATELQDTPMITDDGDGPVQPYTNPPAQAPANGLPS